VGEANVIDRRIVDVLTAHWSVFYTFLLKVVENFLGVSTPYMPSTPLPPRKITPRISAHVAYAPAITGGLTQPPHPHSPNHYSDTLQGSKETAILLHSRLSAPLAMMPAAIDTAAAAPHARSPARAAQINRQFRL